LQVLVLDYLQLCSVPNKGNRTDEIGEISRGLKGLAKELGIAVLALSQLNRDVEKRTGGRPTLSDLRSSGDIEQDADCVMFLWRGVLALQFDGKYQFWGESMESLAMPSKRQEPFYSRGLN
jgi:replicative DNA helicase